MGRLHVAYFIHAQRITFCTSSFDKLQLKCKKAAGRTVITGMQPDVFQGRGCFVKLRHFDKHFVKNTQKQAGKILEFFLLDTLNSSMNTIRAFFSKIRALFSIFKKRKRRPPPPPSCAPESYVLM